MSTTFLQLNFASDLRCTPCAWKLEEDDSRKIIISSVTFLSAHVLNYELIKLNKLLFAFFTL